MMLKFYRMDRDNEGTDHLTLVDVCAIQGDRIDAIIEKFHTTLFFLMIDDNNRIAVRREFSPGSPAHVMDAVEEWLNEAPDLRALPTYYYDHILINGVDRIPHLYMVYIAESEEAVWEFVKG
jgi:hypothetical protein